MNATKWLEEDGSYADGVAILRMAGVDVSPFLAALQLPFVPSAAKQKLRERIAAMPLPAELPVAEPDLKKVLVNDPPEVHSLRLRGQKLMKLQADMHARLKLATSDTDRYQLAEAIMEEVIPELDKVYTAIRAYETTGALPPDNADHIRRETIAQMQKIESLKPRISRLQNWLNAGKKDGKELTAADQRGYEKELLEKQAELADLREKLGLDE